MNNTTHVWRVFSILILAIVVGFILQRLLRPASFGELGHFRASSLNEIIQLEQIHQGRESCRECHQDIIQVHEKDIHFAVQCEDCHGPGNLHVKYHRGENKAISQQLAAMPKEYTLEGCLFCHRKLSARPRTFAQIDPIEHYAFLKVTDRNIKCIECHSPHEPLFLLGKVKDARIHPMIYECVDCHDTEPEKDLSQVEDHPVVFVCRDCHPAIVKDFLQHEHSFLRCTACHLFHRENETSGRIFKNGNRRFCLLCHEAKPFKDKSKLPQIVYSDHIAEMSEVMRRTPEELAENPTACLTCHFDFIHDSKLIRELQEQRR